MKIYFITSKLNFRTSGGSIEEIDYIIRTLIKLGNEVTVITAFSSSNDISLPLPYKVIEENVRSHGLLGMQKEVYFLLKKYSLEADIFHVDAHLFMYGAGIYKLLGGKVPIVAFFNQFLTCWPQYSSSFFPQTKVGILPRAKKKIRWLIERYVGMFLLKYLDILSYVSPNLRSMYENFGARKEKSIVIGDPIDFKSIMEANGITPDFYRQRLKRIGPITILYSSRMSPGKGFDVLLLAFSKLKDKDHFRLILGGTGPEAQFVRDMVLRLNLTKYVTLPGWVSKEQLYEYYRTADIFIQADWWPAGTSISLLYALAFGLPSILPAGGGLQWNAGKSALYFKYRDVDELARQIERLEKDHELRVELSGNCFRRLAEDDMNMEKRIFGLFKEMEDKVNSITNR